MKKPWYAREIDLKLETEEGLLRFLRLAFLGAVLLAGVLAMGVERDLGEPLLIHPIAALATLTVVGAPMLVICAVGLPLARHHRRLGLLSDEKAGYLLAGPWSLGVFLLMLYAVPAVNASIFFLVTGSPLAALGHLLGLGGFALLLWPRPALLALGRRLAGPAGAPQRCPVCGRVWCPKPQVLPPVCQHCEKGAVDPGMVLVYELALPGLGALVLGRRPEAARALLRHAAIFLAAALVAVIFLPAGKWIALPLFLTLLLLRLPGAVHRQKLAVSPLRRVREGEKPRIAVTWALTLVVLLLQIRAIELVLGG